MAKYINITLNGNRVRYAPGAQFASIYSAEGPKRVDVRKDREFFDAMVDAYVNSDKRVPYLAWMTRNGTGKNQFAWFEAGRISRYNLTTKETTFLSPKTAFGKQIARVLLSKGFYVD